MKITTLFLTLAFASLSSLHAQGEADKIGRQQYMLCGACHGQSGEGTAAAPPLAGSEWVNGPAENLIRIQLRGLHGPIKVKGVEYSNFPAGMIAMAYQTDEQIAAVLTFVRKSFGNDAPAVTPAEVTALRDEVGKPQLTQADLIPPNGTVATSQPKPVSNKYDDLDASSGFPTWAMGLIALLILAGGFVLLKRKA